MTHNTVPAVHRTDNRPAMALSHHGRNVELGTTFFGMAVITDIALAAGF